MKLKVVVHEAEQGRYWAEVPSIPGCATNGKDFAARKGDAVLQPAVKCRGREYLPIIYGPEYTAERHLQRLRKRDLRTKRSLAMESEPVDPACRDRRVSLPTAKTPVDD